MNYLLIILDACRYDNFKRANTPNMNSVGETRKAHSQACGTLPGMFVMLAFPRHFGHEDFLPSDKPRWIPYLFKERGYSSHYLFSNPFLTAQKEVFSRGFDSFIDYVDKNSAREMINGGMKRKENEPFFMILHFMETHQPYFRGDQRSAIEFLDSELEALLSGIDNTRVVITADHGDTKRGHGPKAGPFNEKMFEVPLIEGVVK